MNFEEFTEIVRDSIRDHLPEQYRGAEQVVYVIAGGKQ